MAAKQDSLRQSQNIQSILIGILIGVAMFGGFYMLYYTPTNKEIESTRDKVVAKENALLTVRTQAPLLKPMTEKVKLLEQQLEVYRTKIAEKGEVISLIKTIEGEAQRLGLKVVDVRTRTELPPSPSDADSSVNKNAPPAPPPAYTKVILNSHMQAGYHKLEEFLETIQDLESFVVIESIDVIKSGEVVSELDLSLELSLYSKIGIDNNYVAIK